MTRYTPRKPRPSTRFLTLLLVAAPCVVSAASEGADIVFGGYGPGPGKFDELRDFTFGQQDILHTLEGRRYNNRDKKWTGNCRVQRFDTTGKYLSGFSIHDDALGDKDRPERMAVDSKGRVWVVRPEAGLLRAYSPEGAALWDIAIPGAAAVTITGQPSREMIAALGGSGRRPENMAKALFYINPDTGKTIRQVPLARPLNTVVDMDADTQGNLYVVATTNQLHKFAPDGKLLLTSGSGTWARVGDGSELINTVAVDAKGFIYSQVWGNPTWVIRFDPGVTTSWKREGQYKWANGWSPNELNMPLAFDSTGRLWVGATVQNQGNPRFHPSPSILRTRTDFLDEKNNKVVKRDALLLGFRPSLTTTLPYDIAYDLSPVTATFAVAPSNRRIHDISVAWNVVDENRAPVAKGTFRLALKDGQPAGHTFTFTPPRLGWYTLTAEILHNGKRIQAIGRHLGVTREFPGMPRLAEGESKGGWADAPRQVFAGLHNMRLHVTGAEKSQETLDKDIEAAKKYGATYFVQITDKSNCSPEIVRNLATRFKGRVPVWEFVNEPNLTMSAENYAKLIEPLYPIIKAADPDALVMGPNTCGINLDWIRRFLKAGGGDHIDIVGIHDYEGHETIDPLHWRWKYAALRDLLAEYNCGGKPLWQTERVITAIRGNQFLGTAQAVRTTLHRDLLETLGVPPRHNNHYYLNQGGYGSMPSYLWSKSGPHPGALALRVRHALTAGAGLRYAGELDFGPLGNTLFLGLRYTGADGDTLILRNLGMATPEPIEITVNQGTTLDVTDAYGNPSTLPVTRGKATLTPTQMPLYLRLKKGQDITLPRPAFGRNIAPRATFTYSGATDRPMSLLNNGVIETTHAGSPVGGTDGRNLWSGKINTDEKGAAIPESLDITFGAPRTIDTLLLYGARPDNAFCALLDYDILGRRNGKWEEITRVRAALPPSDLVETAQSRANTWLPDNNLHLHHLKPVTVDALRITVRRTSHGFYPDAAGHPLTKLMPQALMLREVAVFGPDPAAGVFLASPGTSVTAPFATLPVDVTVSNAAAAILPATVKLTAPDGWAVTPATHTLRLQPGAAATFPATLTAPPVLPRGTAFLNAELSGDGNKTLDHNWLRLDITPSFDLIPRPVRTIDKDTQRLTANIRNHGGSPLSGELSVALEGSSRTRRAKAAFGPVAPGKTADVNVDFPGVKLAGTGNTAVYTATADRMSVSETRDISLLEWSVVGSFPRDFGKDFGPESNLDLRATYTDGMGAQQRWKTLSSNSDGFINLGPAFSPNQNCCAYAAIWVRSPDARAAILALGSDDGTKAWLNGTVAIANDAKRGAKRGQDQIPVKLRAGWNTILLKITQGDGGWGFYCDLLDPARRPMTDLDFSPTPKK